MRVVGGSSALGVMVSLALGTWLAPRPTLAAPTTAPRSPDVQIVALPGRADTPDFEADAAGRSSLATHLLAEGHWEHLTTPHFVVYFEELTDRTIGETLEQHLGTVQRTLARRQPLGWREPAEVFILKGPQAWRGLLARHGEPHPDGVRAFANAEAREIFVSRFALPSLTVTLAHEVAHLVLPLYAGTYALPLWVNEGFAESQSASPTRYPSLRARIEEGTHLPLPDLLRQTAYPTDLSTRRLFYLECRSVVEFLLRAEDEDTFLQFVRLHRSLRLEDALFKSYGARFRTMEDLDAAWRASLLQR